MHKKCAHIILFSLFAFSCFPPASYRGGWMFSNENRHAEKSPRRVKIIDTAKKYIGIRYRNGGASPAGFDCSGFVHYVYSQNGIYLPRSARKQYYKGNRISYRSMRPGDLIFFRTAGARISHVAIYLGDDSFIHAPSSGKKVSIDDMSNKYWIRRYVGCVTYL